MDSLDNKACCSKTLNNTAVVNDEIIIIVDEDSTDSAYNTVSSVSKLSPPPPAEDNEDITKLKDHNFVNIHNAGITIEPWELCRYIGKYLPSKGTYMTDDVICITDSDTEDESLPKPNKNDEIICLDDDDDDSPTFPLHIIEKSYGVNINVPEYNISHRYAPNPRTQLRPETRIVARRNEEFLPWLYTPQGLGSKFWPKIGGYYAGIISHISCFKNECWHYLAFFDDGHVQYVSNNDIRVVFGNYGYQYVHQNARTFYDYYFGRPHQTELLELVGKVGEIARTFIDGKFERAEFIRYNEEQPGIVLVHFLESNQAEWLYVGSPRFEVIWKSIVMNKRLKRYHAANTTMIDVSSDSEEDEDDYSSPKKKPLPPGIMEPSQRTILFEPKDVLSSYKPPKKHEYHQCGPHCVDEYESDERIFSFDPLKRPLLAGWIRKIGAGCTYVAPCGRPIKTIETTYKFLIASESKLTIDCFAFSTRIDCLTEVCTYSHGASREFFLNDIISNGFREKQRIPVIPITENLPYFKKYVIQNSRNPRSKKVPDRTTVTEFRSSCDCVGDCSVKSKCSCWKLTLDGSISNSAGYKYKRLEGRVDTGIFECNPGCKCSGSCSNRVVTAQIEQKLEVYETKDRGYGIRCQTDLPKGTFVSCYFGDLLHGKTADERAMKQVGSMFGDEYFMQLDFIENAEKYKEGYESDEDEENPSKRQKMDEEPKSRERNYPNNIIGYFPDTIKKRSKDENDPREALFGENASEFVVDGRYRGNISRFYNHSCQPNLFSQSVFVDTHDLRFPWLAFFTSEDIRAGTELTWDYAYTINSIEGRAMECRCGAPNCRKRLL